MEADDVKLGAKVVLFALVLVLLLRTLTNLARVESDFGRRPRGLGNGADVMLRLDAARRPPLRADG